MGLAPGPGQQSGPTGRGWGSRNWDSPFGSVPSGSLTLDEALGTAGYPRNHITELFGPEGSGKTTLAMEAVAALQALGGCALILDLEHSWDDSRATALGIRPETAFIARPVHGEDAMDIAEEVLRSGAIDLVVIDSLTAWLPPEEYEHSLPVDFGERQAESTRRAIVRLAAVGRQKHSALLVTNQLRGRRSEGYSERTAGWPALQLLNSIRIRLEAAGPLAAGGSESGLEIGFRITKNALRSRAGAGTLQLWFQEGLRRPEQAIAHGLRWGVVHRSPDGLIFNGQPLGPDLPTAADTLRKRAPAIGLLEAEVRKRFSAAGI